MKIRSYKGPSLETLYDTIQKDLGPEAIVISTKNSGQKNPLLRPLLGSEQHELIAVVDDESSERHLLDVIGQSEIREINELQTRKWKEMDIAIRQIKGEIQNLSKGMTAIPRADSGIPEFAADWDPRFVRELEARLGRALEACSPDDLRIQVAQLLRVESTFPALGKTKPHVIVFAGPTGSGKTTTLAKLAARWCLDEKLKVGIMTTDTFRVAAVDQIKEYATLLGIELAVVFSAGEAANAVKRFADKDVILVDTPGRNHYDQIGLAGIRGLLQAMGTVTILLHVPAMVDRRHVSELISNFQIIKPNSLILTKTDEVRRFDLLTTLAAETVCPIAYITDGQRVPQDIHPATVETLKSWLVPNSILQPNGPSGEVALSEKRSLL